LGVDLPDRLRVQPRTAVGQVVAGDEDEETRKDVQGPGIDGDRA